MTVGVGEIEKLAELKLLLPIPGYDPRFLKEFMATFYQLFTFIGNYKQYL
jgi:hypothetical protein